MINLRLRGEQLFSPAGLGYTSRRRRQAGRCAGRRGAPQVSLERRVRHELLMLPYYSIFDNLEFRVDGRDVELFGQVRNPVLKSDAYNVVKRIEGVRSVTNNVKVLPLSNFDDRIR